MRGKVVFITGASAGIGEACARAFAGLGCRLILSARRRERLEALGKELLDSGVDVLVLPMDVGNRREVEDAMDSLPPDWREIEVLVNNAGLALGLDPLHEGKVEDWDRMIDTNVKGLLYVTRAVLPGMVKRNRGHIINIGSIAGREVYKGGTVYCATKHAVRAITLGLRLDLLGTNIRVTTVDPGMVETEFSIVRFKGDVERAREVYEGLQPLTARDIADAVVYCATRLPHVNISEMVVMPTHQASATKVYRQK